MVEPDATTKGADSIDPADVARFARLADAWWDPQGPFKPLHRLNPTRIAYIRDQLCAHFRVAAGGLTPLANIRVLDVGCGGGLAAEPLTRLGARVVGIDAAPQNIRIAAHHAAMVGLEIDYRAATAEQLAAEGESFDAVLALEIVEHVNAPQPFVRDLGRLVRPGGALIVATLNRTAKSFLFAIVGAEWVLRWLPPGTHRWEKFLRPSELTRYIRAAGLVPRDIRGVTFNPLTGEWRLDRDVDVNYMIFATRPAA